MGHARAINGFGSILQEGPRALREVDPNVDPKKFDRTFHNDIMYSFVVSAIENFAKYMPNKPFREYIEATDLLKRISCVKYGRDAAINWKDDTNWNIF